MIVLLVIMGARVELEIAENENFYNAIVGRFGLLQESLQKNAS
jgi:hypothetical protein